MKPSIYQQSIYDFITTGTGNAVVSAVAGSGKTTTIVNALSLINTHKSVVFLAFNKSIVDELKTKVPQTPNINVSTLHSIGFSAIKHHSGKQIETDSSKYKKLLNALISAAIGDTSRLSIYNFDFSQSKIIDSFMIGGISDNNATEYANRIMKLNDLLRVNLVNINDGHLSVKVIEDIASRYGVEITDNEAKRALILAQLGSTIKNSVDFTDMIWFPNIYNMSLYKFDYVFIDECQDLNAAQRNLMLKCIRPQTGRFVAVGDPNQAIYGFAGADINSYNELCNLPNTIQMPLSVCYRCGINIVNRAKEIVPQIEPSEFAKEGAIDINADIPDIQIGDMVLCRLTFPLVELCMRYLSKGIPAKMVGSDIGLSLVNMIKGQQRKRESFTMTNVYERLQSELGKIMKKVMEKTGLDAESAKDDNTYTSYKEKIMVIREIANGEEEPDTVISKISKMFSDGGGSKSSYITLSTVHKAKGLEADRVFIIHPSKMPLIRKGQKAWELQQEKNLLYVAITRAKSHLGFIAEDLFDAYNGQAPVIPNTDAVIESEYMGEVGEKIPVVGQIIDIKSISTASYGNTNIYVIRDQTGNIIEKIGEIPARFLTYCDENEQLNWRVCEGCKVSFNGTVKSHKEYKGEKITTISHIATLKTKKSSKNEA